MGSSSSRYHQALRSRRLALEDRHPRGASERQLTEDSVIALRVADNYSSEGPWRAHE